MGQGKKESEREKNVVFMYVLKDALRALVGQAVFWETEPFGEITDHQQRLVCTVSVDKAFGVRSRCHREGYCCSCCPSKHHH